MAEVTKIQWTHHTFNPWIGCAHVSPGCNNCYAEQQNYFVNIQRSKGRELWGKDAQRHIASKAKWREIHRWNRAAELAGERHRVFVASLADVFEDRFDVIDPRAWLFDAIAQCPWLDFLLLTKRPENAPKLIEQVASRAAVTDGVALARRWKLNRAPANVWMGVTGEDCKRLGERVEALSAVPAVVRFVSAEPLLEDIGDELEKILGVTLYSSPSMDETWARTHPSMVDWVILGGESGPRARPCAVEWIRRALDICRGAHVAPFVKQLGSKPTNAMRGIIVDGAVFDLDDLKHPKGGEMKEWPADLRVQEFPKARRS